MSKREVGAGRGRAPWRRARRPGDRRPPRRARPGRRPRRRARAPTRRRRRSASPPRAAAARPRRARAPRRRARSPRRAATRCPPRRPRGPARRPPSGSPAAGSPRARRPRAPPRAGAAGRAAPSRGRPGRRWSGRARARARPRGRCRARHVADHRRQLLGEPRVVGVLGQVLLALGAGDLVDAREHRLEVAEALQQLRGGLVADAGDARDVVRGVALEADEVGHELGRDPVAVDHALAVVDLRVGDAARGRHDPHAVLDELVRVAVAGDDHHRDAALLGLLGERGDHVVGLEALDRDVAVAEGLDQRAQVRPLELEQVGPARALGLVVGRQLLAAGHPRVPDDDRRHRTVVREDLHEHRGESEDRVGRPPVGGGDRLGKREERPIGQGVAVDQEELAGRAAVVSRHGPQGYPRRVVGRPCAAMIAERLRHDAERSLRVRLRPIGLAHGEPPPRGPNDRHALPRDPRVHADRARHVERADPHGRREQRRPGRPAGRDRFGARRGRRSRRRRGPARARRAAADRGRGRDPAGRRHRRRDARGAGPGRGRGPRPGRRGARRSRRDRPPSPPRHPRRPRPPPTASPRRSSSSPSSSVPPRTAASPRARRARAAAA